MHTWTAAAISKPPCWYVHWYKVNQQSLVTLTSSQRSTQEILKMPAIIQCYTVCLSLKSHELYCTFLHAKHYGPLLLTPLKFIEVCQWSVNFVRQINKVITGVSYFTHRHTVTEEDEWLTADRMAVSIHLTLDIVFQFFWDLPSDQHIAGQLKERVKSRHLHKVIL